MLFHRLIFALAVCFSPIAASAGFAGNDGPHAGDYISSEFIRHGEDVIKLLNNPLNAALLNDEQRRSLVAAVRDTPVHSVSKSEETLRDPHSGDPVDALTVDDASSPTGTSIRLQHENWQALFSERADVYHLVFHEYLWVLGLDDSNFRISLHLNTSGMSQTDALSGRTWYVSEDSLSITIKYYFIFDEHQSYRLIGTVTDASDFGIRAMESYGTYTLEADGTVNLQRRGRSCPLPQDAFGVTTPVVHFKEGTLRLDAVNGGNSVFFQPINAVDIKGYVNWGCIVPPATFSAYNEGILGKPVLPVPNTAVATANANDRYQAISYSYRTKSVGQSWNQYTPKDAIRRAGESCGQPDCAMMAWSTHCVAAAVHDVAQKSWTAWDADRAKAENVALQTCNSQYGNGCRLVATVCRQP